MEPFYTKNWDSLASRKLWRWAQPLMQQCGSSIRIHDPNFFPQKLGPRRDTVVRTCHGYEVFCCEACFSIALLVKPSLEENDSISTCTEHVSNTSIMKYLSRVSLSLFSEVYPEQCLEMDHDGTKEVQNIIQVLLGVFHVKPAQWLLSCAKVDGWHH